MKVLVASTVFAPSIGGMETVAGLLVRGLLTDGHDVTVLTYSKSELADSGPAAIFRQPSIFRTFRCFLRANAIILVGVTLRLGWPLISCQRTALITHQGFRPPEPFFFLRWFRNILMSKAKNVACSKAVAVTMGANCLAVGNPYDDTLFVTDRNIERSGDLVFVGRLTPEKGIDVLLEAIAILFQQDIRPNLTIVGSGPLRKELEESAIRLKIGGQVHFAGPMLGAPLVKLLNRHKILVVPSTWEEPFGIVALEGIACGCAVIGANGGGLPEAIGPCGITFETGNKAELSEAIRRLLSNPELMASLLSHAPEHLADHRSESVVRRYSDALGLSSHAIVN